MCIRKALKANGLNQNKKGGNMGKVKVLFLVAVLSIFILGGIGYAMTAMINAAKPAMVDVKPEVVDKAIADEAARNTATTQTPVEPGTGTLSSNATVTVKSLASGEILKLDGVADMNLIQLAATTISAMTQQQVQALYDYSLSLTENQAVVIVGNTDEEANTARQRFADMTLRVDNAPRLFFGVVENNPTFVNNLGSLFTQFNGDYTKCTVDAYRQVFGGTGRAV
jgi:hypothetical protein